MPSFFLTLKAALLALTLVLVGQTSAQAQATVEPIKTVYHLSDGVPQAAQAMANIRNHLTADPKAKIVVVAHGHGIDFLLPGATTSAGLPFAGTIADLANSGVEFRVCNNTLQARGIDPSKVAMEATLVPSGVAEVARLQAREHFVYLRP